MFQTRIPPLIPKQHHLVQILRPYAKALKRRPVRVMTVDLTDEHRRRGQLPRAVDGTGAPVPGTVTWEAGVPRGTETGSSAAAATTGRHRAETDHTQPVRGSQLSENKIGGTDFMYNRIGDSDRRYRQLLQAFRSRQFREKKGVVVLEGNRLIKDAVSAGVTLKSVFFDKVEHMHDLESVISSASTSLFKLSIEQMKAASDVVTSPGVIAVAKMPVTSDLCVDWDNLLPITLVCDNLRDPGNLGTLLRSAAAVGCRKVLLTKGCVDMWEPKVVRAAAGCLFRSHILQKIDWQMINNLLPKDVSLFLADTQDKKEMPSKNQLMRDENLNDIPDKQSTGDARGRMQESAQGQNISTSDLNFSTALPPVSIYSTDFGLRQGGECAVVVGGETEGLSAEAYQSAVHRRGQRLYLPMAEGVDSLNAAMAGTAILFEIKRQLLSSKS